jgi:hypothetical protein
MGFFENLAGALSGEDEKIAQLRRRWLALIRRADAFGAQEKEGVSRGMNVCIQLCAEAFPEDRGNVGGDPIRRASQQERDNFRRRGVTEVRNASERVGRGSWHGYLSLSLGRLRHGIAE